MRLPGLQRLARAARWLRNKVVRKGLILLYHRMAESPLDPFLLCVTPQHFAEHLEVLIQSYHPMPLNQLVQGLQGGEFPDRAVVVTLDDGYANNLYVAKPKLERFGIPATVFITTDYMGDEHTCWEDTLTRTLLHPGTLPATLRLNIRGKIYQWQLGESADYSAEDFGCYRRWNMFEKVDPSPRHFLYRSLYLLLRGLSEGERGEILDGLLVWAHADTLAQSTCRILCPDEVLQLVKGGLVEVGAHSVTHSLLPELSVADQRIEIEASKTRLEEVLGHPVASFAYPYGEYTPETIAIVQEAGFSSACSTLEDVVWRWTNAFAFPRIPVQDCDGEAFAGELRKWFDG